jgi:tetratricopeptide (TPR) repeat protein
VSCKRTPTRVRALRTESLAAALAAATLLGGCALPFGAGAYKPQYRNGTLQDAPAGLPAQAHVAGLPFYPDDSNYCGPASLAAVLNWSGANTTVAALVPQHDTSLFDGTLQYDLLDATRRAARVAYVLPQQLAAVFAQVAAGIPVMALQRVGAPLSWHFAVVTGYDLKAETVTLHSSTARDLVLSIGQFDRSWAPGERWAFVALKPGQLPSGVTEFGYLNAVSPVERVAPDAARQAYEASIARWPKAWIAMMGLGNMAYSRKDYAQAAIHFAQAARAQPNDGDPLNNLAQALLAAGDLRAAQGTIEQAMHIGKPNPDVYRKTQAQIEDAMRR